MKTYNITVEGKTESDIEIAIEEVLRLVKQGYFSGSNSNDSGSHNFSSEGDYEDEEECGDEIVNATYVSVWDGGTEISTSCKYNKTTGDVTDIDSADVDGLDILDREYIVLEDGEEIEDFTIDGEEKNS